MHMADALLSPAVGVAMCAVSAGAIACAAKKIRDDELCEKKVPLMAVAGAFVFAAQMINFTIPGTGSSGHIGGGILLAAMLGACPSFLTLATVLMIQCLFFADGGLLALGCNIFNIAAIPCLLIYPLVFKPIVAKGTTPKRIAAASTLSVVIGLQFGAFAVVAETLLSGITQLPFSTFLLLMQPIHLAIGVVEGIVTASILCFVYAARPEILGAPGVVSSSRVSPGKVVLAFAIAALLAGGALSHLASAYPDGLEWSIEKTAGTTELKAKGALLEGAAKVQETTAVMPDYNFHHGDSRLGTSVAGLAGGAITLAAAGLTGFALSRLKRPRGNKNTASA